MGGSVAAESSMVTEVLTERVVSSPVSASEMSSNHHAEVHG
jgi:hypothetical protein